MDTETEILVRKKFDMLEPIFDEQARRLWAAAQAQVYGYRGISVVARATGLSRTTIHQGMKDIEELRGKKALEKGAFVHQAECGSRSASMTLRYARTLKDWSNWRHRETPNRHYAGRVKVRVNWLLHYTRKVTRWVGRRSLIC
jgi:hypothetical protein